MQLSAVKLVEHFRSGDDNDALLRLTGCIGESPSQEGLSGTRGADEERVCAPVEKGHVVQCEVSALDALASRRAGKVEGVDSVDFGKVRLVDTARDGAFLSALSLLITELVDNVQCGGVLSRGLCQHVGDGIGHAASGPI